MNKTLDVNVLWCYNENKLALINFCLSIKLSKINYNDGEILMITEKVLIENCHLTLSGLKSASLFSIKINFKFRLEKVIEYWSKKLAIKDVSIALLKHTEHYALIYVYRKKRLLFEVNEPRTKSILKQYGYDNFEMRHMIERLKLRLSNGEEFPHEVGLFLGYPPKDVESFICHKGKNCALCGYWKVYHDTDNAIKQFAKFNKCKLIYNKLWSEGRDILSLTVA